MSALHQQALVVMTSCFRSLEDRVPKPVKVVFSGGPTLRYAERTIQQALILKLARYISGLSAIGILVEAGHVQEQAVLQRTLDEIHEDIQFLTIGAFDGQNKLHRKYLETFWEEGFEEGVSPLDSYKPRYQVGRKDIRAVIDRASGITPGSRESRASPVLSQAFSAFVHASAACIMDMCDNQDFRFCLTGLRSKSMIGDYKDDAQNYYFRGLLASISVAYAVEDTAQAARLNAYREQFEEAVGTTYGADVRSGSRTPSSNGD